MSTHPGVTSKPSASSSLRPCSSTEPTAVIAPSSTATSAVRAGAPVPSTTVPPRITTSCMAKVLAVRRLSAAFLRGDVAQLLLELLLLGRRAHGCALHGHDLADVAFDTELAVHERLHGRLRTAVDEELAGDVVGHGGFGGRVVEVAAVEDPGGQVHLGVAHGPFDHRDVQLDVVAAGRPDVA